MLFDLLNCFSGERCCSWADCHSANDNYSYVSPEENLFAVYEELDEVISLDEISNVIAKLKPNKSCGEDFILNEIFIKC